MGAQMDFLCLHCAGDTFLSCLQELKDFVQKGLTIKLILMMKLYQFVYFNLHVNVSLLKMTFCGYQLKVIVCPQIKQSERLVRIINE